MLERQARAPGVVIRLSRQDLEARGYTEVLDILDDLPGMDVIRPWGDNYVKVYWRGYRTDVSFPFLLMIDGIVTNSIWTTDGSHIVALPLSMVDHIEVVYGPTSVVYGANAVMGVINVVTAAGAGDGTTARARVSAGAYHTDRLDQRVLDAHLEHRAGDLRLSLAGRLSLGWTDREAAERFEYTRAAYADDERLWGGYRGFENLARGANSPIEQRGIDARIAFGNLELVARQLSLATGYALVYPTDQAQPFARWIQEEREAYLRHKVDLASGITARTTVRARTSGIDRESYYLAGFNETVEGGGARRVAQVSYWQAINDAYAIHHDLEAEIAPWLILQGGVKYARRDLARAYDVTALEALPPGEIVFNEGQRPDLPVPPDDVRRGPERVSQDDYGAYLHARAERSGLLGGRDVHTLHVGARADYNSQFGDHHSPTLRFGYVGEIPTARGTLVAKLLYGEAFHEPNPRQLYGGWEGSGSAISLLPESSRTFELNVSHTTPRLAGLISGYYVRNAGTIRLFANGASERPSSEFLGADVHLQALLRPPGVDHLSVWAFYSYIWGEEEDIDEPVAEETIGDVATHKAWLGATARISGRYVATVRGRAIAARDTVDSNPIREIGGYAVLDAVARVERLFDDRVSLTLRVDNALGTAYSHPGIRTADGGETPGYWDGDRWVGSVGYYNSRLPQPGRRVMVTLGLDY
jgi:outer membrane receptor for ferrienterochelin and colicins